MSDIKKNKRKQARQRDYDYIGKIKEKGECLICLIRDNESKLTFHHRDPKKKINNVQRLASMGLSITAINREIEKCDLLCEECHKMVHQIGIYKYEKFKRFLRKNNKL